MIEDFSANSSIFQSKTREEDLATSQKIEEIKKAIGEFAKKAASQSEKVHDKLNDKVGDLLFKVESCIQEDDSESDDGWLQKIYELLKNFFSEFGIYLKERDLKTHLLKKEKDKNWLFSIIKALCNGLRKLFNEIFKQNLGWEERLEKEIKELNEKIESGELSQGEMEKAQERLKTLYSLKLSLQLGLAFLVIGIVSRFLEFVLGPIEVTKEEGKKIESKEPGVEQVRESVKVEAKVSEKEVQPKNLEKPLVNPREMGSEEKKPFIPMKSDLSLSNLPVKQELFVLPKPVEPEQKVVQVKPKEPVAAAPTPPAKAPEQPKVEVRKESKVLVDLSSKIERMDNRSVNEEKETIKTANKPKPKIGDFYNQGSKKITEQASGQHQREAVKSDIKRDTQEKTLPRLTDVRVEGLYYERNV